MKDKRKESELVKEIDSCTAYYQSINCITYPYVLLKKIKEYLVKGKVADDDDEEWIK